MKLFALLALVTLWSDVAEACSCRPPDPPLVELGNAKVVFAGEVVAKRDSFAVDSSRSRTYGQAVGSNWGSFVTVRVLKWWKWDGRRLADDSSSTAIQDARADTLVTVVTSGDGASCGYAFRVGERYLIYGSELWGRLESRKAQVTAEVSLCSRTRPLLHGWTDVVSLGVGEQDRAWSGELLKRHSFPSTEPDTSEHRLHTR